MLSGQVREDIYRQERYACYFQGSSAVDKKAGLGGRDMISFFILTLTAINLVTGPTQTPYDIFRNANISYEAGEYHKASEKYSELTRKGYKSGNLYYNLGNAYMQEEKLGRAILNYERARRYMPADSDLLANLRYARSLMKRQDPPENVFIAIKLLDIAFRQLNLPQTVALATIWYWLLTAYFIVTKIFRKYNAHSTVTVPGMLLVLLVFLVPVKRKIYDLEKGAIVVDKITDARLEPDRTATVNYPLYEGMKVYVIRKRDSWFRVKTLDGRIGWAPKNSIEIIGM
ncbi:MAG: hypothetical protein GF392_00680 [Candidatus Omnitrophica bacterium]|nr:hypothetical protein [Candidatus Omnitrophota bacterium]